MRGDVLLRNVEQDDLVYFFEQQLDPAATHMAAFPSREKDDFLDHWEKILADETIIKETILYNGEVAGNIVSFVNNGNREVGYWLGRKYWGKGIATRALIEFLEYVPERPLYAFVARHNIASIRVLEKCGFEVYGEDRDFSSMDGEKVEGLI